MTMARDIMGSRVGQHILVVIYKDDSMTTLYTLSQESAVHMVREFWIHRGDAIDRIIVARIVVDSEQERI